jgi:6-phosphogluconolactonase
LYKRSIIFVQVKEDNMPYWMYISLQGEDKLSILQLAPETGKLTFQEDVALAGGPAPLAVDPAQQFLYVAQRTACQLSAFRIDPGTGRLSPLGTVPLQADPCFLYVDRTGRFLLAAYYGAGAVSVHAIGRDGALRDEPVEWLSTAAKAHCIQTDASNRYAFVPHVVPSNAIYQFAFDDRTGRLTPNAVPRVTPESEVGPRHICFHPRGHTLYAVNEQGCSVTAYRFSATTGTLSPLQTLSTLPDGFDGPNTCAQIHISPSGQFLYAANRGHDSIACYKVDAASGRLAVVGQQRTEKTPRAFNLDPEGRFLYVAGLDTGRLASYRIDQQSGALSPLEIYEVGQRPMWVHVL